MFGCVTDLFRNVHALICKGADADGVRQFTNIDGKVGKLGYYC